jgi:hypothetical protein
MSYNGWTNYETWNVKLWLDNDGTTPDSSWPRDIYGLSEYLKDMIWEQAPDLGASMFSDLLTAALQEVEWREIAEAYLEEMKDEEEEEEAEEEDKEAEA